MQRWRIADKKRFLLLCALHAPVLGGVLVLIAAGLYVYIQGFARYGLGQLPMMLLMFPLYAIPATIVGAALGAIPGMLGGCALLLFSEFRGVSAPQFIFVAAVAASLPGSLLPQGWHGAYPWIFAATGAACALILSRTAINRGTIVLYADEPATALQ